MRRLLNVCAVLLLTCAASFAQNAAPGAAAARAAAPANAPQKPVTVKIGDTMIDIPAPEGMVDMTQAPSQIASSFELMAPPSNRSLAGFVLPEIAKLRADQPVPALERYMIVQTLRAIEAMQVSADDFKMVKDEMTRSQDQMMADKKEEINQRLKGLNASGEIGTKLELSEPLMLGTFVNKDDAYSSLMVANVKVDDGSGTPVERAIACGMSLVHVKGKIVYLYVYRQYTDEATLDWVKKTAEKWVNETLAANKAA